METVEEKAKSHYENGKSKSVAKHLNVLSQYLMVIVPFICKIVFQTIDQLKNLSNGAACNYSMKNGFWKEKNRTSGSSKSEKERNRKLNTNDSNCNNHNINSSAPSHRSKTRRSRQHIVDVLKGFDCDALLDIFEMMSSDKLDLKKLSRYVKTDSDVKKLISNWAQSMPEKKEKKIEKIASNISNPFNYIGGLFSENASYNCKFKKSIEILSKLIKLAKHNPIDIEKFIGEIDGNENIADAVLNYVDTPSLSDFKDTKAILKHAKFHQKHLGYKSLVSKEFKNKTKLHERDFEEICNIFDECFTFPTFTVEGDDKLVREIPGWEIQNLFNKYM